MENSSVQVVKSSGKKAIFSHTKLQNSLKRSGADAELVAHITAKVAAELYEGISTKEIYNRAFAMLKKSKNILASKYKLKKAIYELGPTGFPFERFVAALLEYSGYHTAVGKILQGICVTHEIDVLAEKDNGIYVVECKFHSEEGRNCNVKVPLYINSRYNDVKEHWEKQRNNPKPLAMGWGVTNTRFTADAMDYGKCCGLYLLSWDYPKNDGLKDRIDRLGLYPITVSSLLTNREKQFLLSRDVVLCQQLLKDRFFLDHLGMSELRKEKILKEIEQLCNEPHKANGTN